MPPKSYQVERMVLGPRVGKRYPRPMAIPKYIGGGR